MGSFKQSRTSIEKLILLNLMFCENVDRWEFRKFQEFPDGFPGFGDNSGPGARAPIHFQKQDVLYLPEDSPATDSDAGKTEFGSSSHGDFDFLHGGSDLVVRHVSDRNRHGIR